MQCVSNLRDPGGIQFRRRHGRTVIHQPDYAWTDLTYLLHDLRADFDFAQDPRPPVVLPTAQ